MGQFLTGITWAIATNMYVNLYDIGGLTRKAAKMGSKIFEEMYKGVPPWEIEGPQSEIVHLAEHGEIRSPVLDAGCGTGENTLYLAGLGFEVVGIDIVAGRCRKSPQQGKGRLFGCHVYGLGCLKARRSA